MFGGSRITVSCYTWPVTGDSRLIPPQALVRSHAAAAARQLSLESGPLHRDLATDNPAPDAPPLLDVFGRQLLDLRLSVTDRCNLRCAYCMPKEVYGPGYPFLPRSELLSFEELRDVAEVFVGLGVQKLRITGGEPLLRAQLPHLVRLLKPLGAELALTTNGILLAKYATELKEAGLDRVTVSLDALAVDTFRAMSGTDNHRPGEVLTGIDAALGAGLLVKVNSVVRRGVNEDDVMRLVEHFRHTGVPLRFIEYMDVGSTNGWETRDVVPSDELRERVQQVFPLQEVPAAYAGETSRRYAYADGAGEVGFISSVTQPFCRDCSRARISAKGTLYSCLFATSGVDLRGPLRTDGIDVVRHIVTDTWRARSDRYSEIRGQFAGSGSRIEMSYIGG